MHARRSAPALAPLLALALLAPPLRAQSSPEADLAAARELFERSLEAIRARDRESYLACYRDDERLVRAGHGGSELGFAGLAETTPPTAGEAWPDWIEARDLQVHWLADGLVFGTYRYHVRAGGQTREGLSARLFRREDEGWRICVTSAFDAPPGVPAPPLALVGATLHDGSGGAPLRDAAVCLRGGRIEYAGPRAGAPLEGHGDVVDLTGRHLAPGLVDTHVHYSQTGWVDGRPDALDVTAEHPYAGAMAANRRHPERLHGAFLACGVTAVFDVGGYPWTRELGARTELATDAPHVVATGPLLATRDPAELRLPDQRQLVPMESEEGVRSTVRSHAAQGSEAIKLWFVVRDDAEARELAPLVHAAGEAARELALPLAVHATTLESARIAVAAGASLLVHGIADREVDEDFLAAALEARVAYCPTLTVHEGYLHVWRARLPDELRAQLAFVHPSVRERVLATESLRPRLSGERAEALEDFYARQLERMAANLRSLKSAGVPVVLGTDAGNPLTLHGPAVFRELEALQAAGLTPAEVLAAATRDAAAALGRGGDLGLVETGRVADLVVLAEDPTVDASAWRSLTHVVRAGRLHAREHLLR